MTNQVKRQKLKIKKIDIAEVLQTSVFEVEGERVSLNAIKVGDYQQVYATSDKADLPFIVTPKQVLDMSANLSPNEDPAVSVVADFMVESGMISKEALSEARYKYDNRTNNADAIDAQRLAIAMNSVLSEAGKKVVNTKEATEELIKLRDKLNVVLS